MNAEQMQRYTDTEFEQVRYGLDRITHLVTDLREAIDAQRLERINTALHYLGRDVAELAGEVGRWGGLRGVTEALRLEEEGTD